MRRAAFCVAVVATATAAAGCSTSTRTSVSESSTSASTRSQTTATTGAAGCPSASAVSSALADTVSAPQLTKQAGTTMCSYPTASGRIVAISRYADSNYSADDVRGALQSQATALGGSADGVRPVSGIGDAAFEFSVAGATTLGIVSGSAYIAVIGAPGPVAALAVAKLVV